jgi:hypothetical protein
MISSRMTGHHQLGISPTPGWSKERTINDARAPALAPDTIRVQEWSAEADRACAEAERLEHVCPTRNAAVEEDCKV